MDNQYNSSKQEPNQVFLRIKNTLINIFRAIFVSTILYFKNLPAQILNRWERYMNDRKRMPKRKSKHRVYVLIGYTSKEKIDQRYRSLKIQKMITTLLIVGIVLIFFVLVYRVINPKIDVDAYRQMIGVNDFDDLVKKDPFEIAGATIESDSSEVNIVIVTQESGELESGDNP